MTTMRVRGLLREELDRQGRHLYDAIVASRPPGEDVWALVAEDGSLRGPFNAMLLSPAVGEPLQALGAAVRFRSCLTDNQRETAILTVAAERDSQFEWIHHEPLARRAQVREDVLHGLRSRAPVDDLVVATVRELLDRHRLSDASYQDVVAAIGTTGLFELTTLVAYYDGLATQLQVFWEPGRSLV